MTRFWTSVGGGLVTIAGAVAGGVVGSSVSPRRDAVMNGTLIGAGLTAVVWGLATTSTPKTTGTLSGPPRELRFP